MNYGKEFKSPSIVTINGITVLASTFETPSQRTLFIAGLKNIVIWGWNIPTCSDCSWLSVEAGSNGPDTLIYALATISESWVG